ncbi:MAG TPA: malto-oligosyltrehalose trehalohydrolase [Ohtaekwangia sp.]
MIPNVNIESRSIGVNFRSDGSADIRVWAPYAKKMAIDLPAREAVVPLEQKEFGYWHLQTHELKPGELYSFILDDQEEFPDPASLSQPEGVHGPSRAERPADFEWTDHAWKTSALENYIFYELHVGTFSPEGTFEGAEKKIPHLKELGITAVEIMPVAQFPGERNWGYDAVFPFAVQHSYGGVRGLQKFVNACHREGIAVVLDVVYNHLGPEGNYLEKFAPYTTDKYKTPWGKAINFDDAWCDGVRNYYIENVLMWFRDFHIDGLRLDAVHAIKDLSPVHILRDIREHVNKLIYASWQMHYLIVELDLNDPRFIKSPEQDGYGMDAQWVDEFHHALRVTTGQERRGYYEDFAGVKDLAKSYQEAYVYDGVFSPHRLKSFGFKTEGTEGQQFVVFSQNHDQVGNRMLGERTSQLVSFDMRKLLAAATIVSPYLPLLFMGEEYDETNPFLYFVSHSDEELIKNVREGRKKEFAAFHHGEDVPDPQSAESFEHSKLQWTLLKQDHHRLMFEYYKTILTLRKNQPALQHLNRKQLEVLYDEESKTLQLHRWHQEHHILCLMNFSQTPQLITLTLNQSWEKLLDSGEERWNGSSSMPDTLQDKSTLMLRPESFVMYSATYV